MLNLHPEAQGRSAALHKGARGFQSPPPLRVVVLSSQLARHVSESGPLDPAFRANPFPEVTDLFCRLPLPTLFYRPEAVHLGDLMRL